MAVWRVTVSESFKTGVFQMRTKLTIAAAATALDVVAMAAIVSFVRI